MAERILGIQFRKSPTSATHEQRSVSRTVNPHCEVDYVSALDTSLQWKYPEKILSGFQGVILGGSGDFDFDGGRSANDEAKIASYRFLEQLRPLCNYLFTNDIPTFGICYGHQLIGAFAGAKVINDNEQKKTRSHVVTLHASPTAHPTFFDLPQSFSAHYGHKDSLDRVPVGATLVMDGGEACQVSALQYQNNIFSTQFHPELTFDDIVSRIKSSPGYLPPGVEAEEIFTRDDRSSKLLNNFAAFIAK